MSHDWIAVRGARVHNLRNIDVDLPRDRLVVITGLSGSGKSSLAFDTIYAEGQRRYVESLSAYARQFLEQMEKPDVDLIDGLSPAISIEQKTTASNPRSTVGTVTEIYDYLRLLFANIGVPHCPNCDREISSQSLERIMDMVMLYPPDERINVLAPIVRGRKGEFKSELAAIRPRGFTRARIDGQFVALDDEIALDRRRNHTIDVLVDRLIVRSGIERRLSESIELALKLADDIVVINTLEGGDRLFSRRLACPDVRHQHSGDDAARVLVQLAARRLSGVPGARRGLRLRSGARRARRHAVAAGGAIVPWAKGDRAAHRRDARGPAADVRDRSGDAVRQAAEEAARHRAVRRAGGRPRATRRAEARAKRARARAEGSVRRGLRRGRFRICAAGSRKATWTDQEALEPYRALQPCRACEGERLRPESRAVRVKGRRHRRIRQPAVCRRAAGRRDAGAHRARAPDRRARVVREIRERLRFLWTSASGISRSARGAATLSGGEGQRIRLATQIGSQLTGVLYVLDEPSIGLHQRDNRRLLATLGRLRNLGNTVLVVEHDEETIRTADYLVDLGPGAGEHGGHVMFQGRRSSCWPRQASR